MSYQLLGLGSVGVPPIVPALAPSWPWGSVTCPQDGQKLRSTQLPDGTTGYFCQTAGTHDSDVPAIIDPSQVLPTDAYGRAGFWTLTNTIIVAVGLSVALSIGASVAGSLVATKVKERHEADAA